MNSAYQPHSKGINPNLNRFVSTPAMQLSPVPQGLEPTVALAVHLMKTSHVDVKNQIAAHQRKVRTQAKRGPHGTVIMHGPTLDVFPDRIRVTLKFAYLLVKASAASPSWRAFVPTNIYDPTGALSASYAPGVDEWNAFYGQYVVLKSKLKLKTQSATGRFFLGVRMNTAAATTGALTTHMSQPRTWVTQYTGAGAPPSELSLPWISHAEVYGITEDQLRADEEFFGATGVGPNLNLYYSIIDQEATLAAVNVGWETFIEMEVDVEFFDRKSLG